VEEDIFDYDNCLSRFLRISFIFVFSYILLSKWSLFFVVFSVFAKPKSTCLVDVPSPIRLSSFIDFVIFSSSLGALLSYAAVFADNSSS